MTDDTYTDLVELKYQQGLFAPDNANARALCDNLRHNEVVTLREIKTRDIAFHRAYFALLSYVYDWLTPAFKLKIPKDTFYKWVKTLLGQYEVVFTFKDGTKLLEYHSIAFNRMSQKTFEQYVKNQLPLIYDNVIHSLYDYEEAAEIIQNIEETFETFMQKLN